jgi:CHAT domain-containing protein
MASAPPFATREALQASLPEGVAVLDCCATPVNTVAFLVMRDRFAFVDFGATVPLRADVERVVELLDPRRAQAALALELGSALRTLGQRILDPVRAALPGRSLPLTLLVAPDDALARVPFEALLVEDVAPGTGIADWPYLVRGSAVAYTHSATALLALQRAAAVRRSEATYIAFAHPRYPPVAEDLAFRELSHRDVRFGILRPLPATAQEVAAAARLFAGDDAELARLAAVEAQPDAAPDELHGQRFGLFLRGGASEANLRARAEVRTATVLHLACHGSADQELPSLSHLVLSATSATGAERANDGYVFLRDLAGLGIRAELLVLSACETHAGGVLPLEGVASLARAGFAAGAGSVLSSLWRIDDAPARDLMVSFYRHWLGAGMSRATALAAAKREMLATGKVSAWSSLVLWDAELR